MMLIAATELSLLADAHVIPINIAACHIGYCRQL